MHEIDFESSFKKIGYRPPKNGGLLVLLVYPVVAACFAYCYVLLAVILMPMLMLIDYELVYNGN